MCPLPRKKRRKGKKRKVKFWDQWLNRCSEWDILALKEKEPIQGDTFRMLQCWLHTYKVLALLWTQLINISAIRFLSTEFSKWLLKFASQRSWIIMQGCLNNSWTNLQSTTIRWLRKQRSKTWPIYVYNCSENLEILPNFIKLKHSGPVHWHLSQIEKLSSLHESKLVKKVRQSCVVQQSPRQEHVEGNPLWSPLAVTGVAVSCTLIPVLGTQHYITGSWDSNQETYFLHIESPLSRCTTRTVGKLKRCLFLKFIV